MNSLVRVQMGARQVVHFAIVCIQKWFCVVSFYTLHNHCMQCVKISMSICGRSHYQYVHILLRPPWIHCLFELALLSDIRVDRSAIKTLNQSRLAMYAAPDTCIRGIAVAANLVFVHTLLFTHEAIWPGHAFISQINCASNRRMPQLLYSHNCIKSWGRYIL